MQARLPRADRLADLADAVLRYLDHHSEMGPSVAAAATGPQRSNLSRALRGLDAVVR